MNESEWMVLDEETGRYEVTVMSTADILQDIADGLSPTEITNKYEAPQGAIDHLIMGIPSMMVQRDKALAERVQPMRLPRDEDHRESQVGRGDGRRPEVGDDVSLLDSSGQGEDA